MKFGFIGLGNIGRPIARCLMTSENELWVYDLAEDGPAELRAMGAKVAASPADVARNADVIGICVRSDQDVRDVFEGPDGILSAGRRDIVAAIHSTITVRTVQEVAQIAAEHGVAVVDAPISRNAQIASDKSIVFMLGGAPKHVSRARSLVEHAAIKVIETGPLGSAMALKICNNMLSYATMVMGGEAVALAKAAGLDLSQLEALTLANGVASPMLTGTFKRAAGAASIAQGGFSGPSAEAAAGLAEKDLDCALAAARDLDLDLRGVASNRAEIRRAMTGAR